MSITPERKEEIKRTFESNRRSLEKASSLAYEASVMGLELLAALEETERLNADLKTGLRVEQRTAMKWYDELAEAQQTIARMMEGIKEIRGKHVYVSGPSVVYELLGRLIEAHPPCPDCGSNNTIDHPTRTDIRLCVPCEKPYMVTGEGAKES
ncbi:hypothetical protein [Paenibacillus sp. FSL R7-0331]|uniref:hypothetical protein n=1 Tax=Paenibacillus sp. FSL R7-0331 TaxID=1536773 RepID=UPI0004F7226D|nr:hypothetical protein [Paenibacillus sp. FSL R7-0331]AIQ54526.1 hypothetical protein R70331_25385 [Paenibacillus sp. FSL R7-0331]